MELARDHIIQIRPDVTTILRFSEYPFHILTLHLNLRSTKSSWNFS